MLAFTEVSALVFDPALSAEHVDALATHMTVPSLLSLGPFARGTDLSALAAVQSAERLSPQGRDDDIADVAFTGGSSGGGPKAAAYTFERMSALVEAWQEAARHGASDAAVYSAADCRLLRFLPATDSPGVAVLPTLLFGGTLVLQRAFDAGAVLRAIEELKVTAIALYPSHLYQLLEHPDLSRIDRSSLRLLVSYGAPMPTSRMRQAVEVFGPVMHQIYGQSETRMLTALQPADYALDRSERLRSVGLPRPGVELRIRTETGIAEVGQVGEICVRSAYRMNGYWRRPS